MIPFLCDCALLLNMLGSGYVGGCDLGSFMLSGSSGIDASRTLPGGSGDVHYNSAAAAAVGTGGEGARSPTIPGAGGNGLIVVLGDISYPTSQPSSPPSM